MNDPAENIMKTSISVLAQDARCRNDEDWSSESRIEAENLFFAQCAALDPVHFADDGTFFGNMDKATCDEMIDAAMIDLSMRGLKDAEVAADRVPDRIGPRTLEDFGRDAMSRGDEDEDSPRHRAAIARFRDACAAIDPDLIDDESTIDGDETVEALVEEVSSKGLSQRTHDATSTTDVGAIIHVLDSVLAARSVGEAMDAIPDGWTVNLLGPTEYDGCNAMIVPAGHRGAAHRLERRGLTNGRDATRLKALRNSAQWLRDRLSV